MGEEAPPEASQFVRAAGRGLLGPLAAGRTHPTECKNDIPQPSGHIKPNGLGTDLRAEPPILASKAKRLGIPNVSQGQNTSWDDPVGQGHGQGCVGELLDLRRSYGVLWS